MRVINRLYSVENYKFAQSKFQFQSSNFRAKNINFMHGYRKRRVELDLDEYG